jgi:hypothetical protein
VRHVRRADKSVRTVDGIVFDSALEAQRYAELRCLQRAGHISGLACHPHWILAAKSKLVPRGVRYTADFMYMDKNNEVHVEEVKGYATPEYRLRRNWWLSLYGEQYHFHEITGGGERIDYN